MRLKATAFDIEPHGSCGLDYLLIHDGPNVSDPELGKYCNVDGLDTVTGTGNSLLLRFHSDNSQKYDGFTVNWESV